MHASHFYYLFCKYQTSCVFPKFPLVPSVFMRRWMEITLHSCMTEAHQIHTLSLGGSECSHKQPWTSCSLLFLQRECKISAGIRRTSPCLRPGHFASQPIGQSECSPHSLKSRYGKNETRKFNTTFPALQIINMHSLATLSSTSTLHLRTSVL